jgi:hypothetical protein
MTILHFEDVYAYAYYIESLCKSHKIPYLRAQNLDDLTKFYDTHQQSISGIILDNYGDRNANAPRTENLGLEALTTLRDKGYSGPICFFIKTIEGDTPDVPIFRKDEDGLKNLESYIAEHMKK